MSFWLYTFRLKGTAPPFNRVIFLVLMTLITTVIVSPINTGLLNFHWDISRNAITVPSINPVCTAKPETIDVTNSPWATRCPNAEALA